MAKVTVTYDDETHVLVPRVSPGIVYLNDEEWEAFERECREPREPTPSIIRGAKLLDELYGKTKK